jgi:hypothetical protein
VRHEGKSPAGAGARTDAVRIDLSTLPADVDRVVVGASADGGTFGQVPGLYLQVVDAASGRELARFEIGDASTETAFLFGEVYRRGGGWKLRAVGQGYATGLAGFATDFGVSVDDEPPPAAPAQAAPVGFAPPAPPPVPAGSAVPAPPRAPTAAAPPPTISLKKQHLVNMEKQVAAAAPQLLSLTKRAAVSLDKRGLGEHTARVALCLDISLSMKRLYATGKIQQLAERILALGLRFDDDGQVDVFLFAKKVRYAGTLELANHAAFINEAVGPDGLELGTQYGVAIRRIRKHYFGDDGPRTAPRPDATPVYVMFVTDGETFDKPVTAEQIRASSYEPLFWQFIAIGNSSRSVDQQFGVRTRAGSGERFQFLEELDDLPGRYLDNADFFAVSDPANIPDDALYDLLMNEYPGWLEQARRAGVLTR